MNRLGISTLQGRLIQLILIASALALLSVATGIVIYESRNFQPRVLKQLQVPADILKELLRPALDFNSQEEASRYLKTYCETQSGVVEAVVYDIKGEIFASYPDNLITAPSSPEPSGSIFLGPDLTIWIRIEGNQHTLGYLYLHKKIPTIFARLSQYGLMLITVLIALIVVGVTLLLGARRSITIPLKKLSHAIDKTISLEFPMPVEWDRPDELGAVFNGYNSMIVRLKKLNDELVESHRRFRGLFENTEISIWNEDLSLLYERLNQLRSNGVIDLRQYLGENEAEVWSMIAMIKVIDINQATLKLFCVQERGKILPSIDITFGINALDVFVDEVCAIFDKQPLFRCEAEFITLDNNKLDVIISFQIPSTGDGFRSVPVNFIDITERKKAEAALSNANHELLRSNEELQQFAYAASHDLVEPLRSISSSVQLLKTRYAGELDTRADEFIRHAVDGSKRMQALIEDLLAFAQIGAESVPRSGINMNTILTSVLDNLHQAITESHATISHDELPLIVVNQSQWVQLLQNLIANAIKFCGQKPVLIHVGVRSEKNQWVFSVADQGIGIEPQYFERIFELFKRLHSRSEYGGTGVGLALCSKIVSRHGGNLWVESVFGQGTTFFFSLPTNR
jgi:signal transduction histidine kinase